MIEHASDKRTLVLPSTHEVLDQSGVTFHFFVDSAEGVATALDVQGITELSDAAERRLFHNEPDGSDNAPDAPGPSGSDVVGER